MEFTIHKPRSPYLQEAIEYFLFIKSSPGRQQDTYTTLPNTNLCLSLYKNNRVHWDRGNNHCQIQESSNFATSKIYGWHKQAFQVSLRGALDQICVLFTPTGLSQFTSMPLNQLAVDEDPFVQLFGKEATGVNAQLFEQPDLKVRLHLLENFLLKHLRERSRNLVEIFIKQLNYAPETLSIQTFCKDYKIHESTLYRHFLTQVGESAKKFERKHRFRSFLNKLNSAETFTSLSYTLNYADQSHCIKESKKFTGETPSQLVKRIQTIENKLMLLI